MLSNRKKWLISAFVILWFAVFHYESTRWFFLIPLAGRELPKVKFLFPPLGWIFFRNVDPLQTRIIVLGYRGEKPEAIDNRRIFQTRWIGHDNHRRALMLRVQAPYDKAFCRFLRHQFPEYSKFAIVKEVSQTPRQPETDKAEVIFICRSE